jgi:hypothetical protein
MVKEKSQTLEEIAMSLFDEMGVSDTDEGTFSTMDHLPNNDEDSSTLGEQDKNAEPVVDEPKTERLYAGRFKTVEEMEAFVANGAQQQQPMPQPQPKEDEIPDLTREQLIALHEGDDQDRTSYTIGYLQKKMSERNLTDYELETLKTLDSDGKDLYGSYVASKTKREVMAELQPTLQPIQDRQTEESRAAFIANEKAIFDSLESEYDKSELATLKQKTSNPEFVNKVLSQSALGQIISDTFNRGSKATAYKMLLSESSALLKREQANVVQDKKNKSFPSDIGSKSSGVKKAHAQTIEDAFNDSMEELNN